MDQMPACPKCKGEYVYHDSVKFCLPWLWAMSGNGNETVEPNEDQLMLKTATVIY